MRDGSILEAFDAGVKKTLGLADEISGGDNREKLSAVSRYLFEEMRLRDPDDVVAAVIKLADMAHLQTGQPEGMLDGIYRMLEHMRMLRAVQERNERRADQQYFA